MKAIIKKVTFKEEREGRFGGMEYNFIVEYDDKKAYYTSKQLEQTHFVEGVETEFTEEKRESKAGNTYYIVKPPRAKKNSNFNRQLKREQSKYSGFAVSYVKDLIVAGIVVPQSKDELMATWKEMSEDICNHMVELDKKIES